MISHTTEKFRELYSTLPEDTQKQARIAYSQFKHNPYHPSLRFKRVHSNKPIYSVRINIDYRAVGIVDNGEIVWFWIGPHREYEKILQKLVVVIFRSNKVDRLIGNRSDFHRFSHYHHFKNHHYPKTIT